MIPAKSIDTVDYFNKSQYKGTLDIVADGRFGNYSIKWSSGGKIPPELEGTYTDTKTAEIRIMMWLDSRQRISDFKERKANAKVTVENSDG